MTLLALVILIVVIGFNLWLIKTAIPMEPKTYQVLLAVVLFVVVLIVLNALGLLAFLDRPVPHVGSK